MAGVSSNLMADDYEHNGVVSAVVVLDADLANSLVGASIRQGLQIELGPIESRRVRITTSTPALQLPCKAVRWMVRDEDSDRWSYLNYLVLIMSPDECWSKFREAGRSPGRFLRALLGAGNPPKPDLRLRLLLVNDRPRAGGMDNNASDMLVDLEASHHVEVEAVADVNALVLDLVRCTKSVLSLVDLRKSQDSTNYGDWVPKKGGASVSVSNNEEHTGLKLLWQKMLALTSRSIGIEEAKVIAADRRFSSPRNCIETFLQDPQEAQAALMATSLRPSGATGDVVSMRVRQKVGKEASRKVYRTLVSLDGDEIL